MYSQKNVVNRLSIISGVHESAYVDSTKTTNIEVPISNIPKKIIENFTVISQSLENE